MLDPDLARARQKRLLDALADRKLDAVVIADPQHVYYLTAFRPSWLHVAALVLFADGRSWLTTANAPAERAAVDDCVAYEASRLATLRQEQPAVAASRVIEALTSRRVSRIGVDASAVTSQLPLMWEIDAEAIDPVLWQLRRRKDADELALIRKAAACADAMYHRAREIVRPGALEIEVYAELHAAAVREAGEPMTALLGNDYTCGGGGGPPRAGRAAKAGELYILDVGPTYRGYFADACRAIAVNGNPTDLQSQAWEAVAAALHIIDEMARPGVRCRDIYQTVFEQLDGKAGAKFPHHLGHGVGLQPHEYPHLNPKWDDVLLEGEVFTAEPGLYAPPLKGGIRLENMYLVTATGVENLIRSPLEL